MHSRDDITVNPDPAALPDVTGTLEDVMAAPGSFSHIHLEKVPWRVITSWQGFGSQCKMLLAPGGILTIETGMHAPILDLGSVMRLPCASPMRIDTSGKTLQLEQRLLHEPGSPTFTGTVRSRHRLFRDDPHWSYTDATLHEQFRIPLTRARLNGPLAQSVNGFAARACEALSLPDDPDALTLSVHRQCLRMRHREDLTVGSILEQHLQDAYAAHLDSQPIAKAQIPVLHAADAYLGNTQHSEELIVPHRTLRLIQELAALFATPPLMVIAAALVTDTPCAHEPSAASRASTVSSRGVVHMPAYLLREIATGAASQGSPVGQHLADLVDAFANASRSPSLKLGVLPDQACQEHSLS